MLNYANSFSLSTSEDKSKVLLHFGQNYPVPTSEDDCTMKNEMISSIIFDADTAVTLALSILDNLDQLEDADDDENEDSSPDEN